MNEREISLLIQRLAFEEHGVHIVVVVDDTPLQRLKKEVGRIAEDYKKVSEILKSMEPTDSQVFINNKMKWKKERWQR